MLEEEIETVLEKEFVVAVDCCVRGYHICKLFSDVQIGSKLLTKHRDDPQSIHGKFIQMR